MLLGAITTLSEVQMRRIITFALATGASMALMVQAAFASSGSIH